MIPVRFTRADGQRKILALVATELVGTVEGATEGERTLQLPPEDSFFEGGGGGSVAHPWQISKKTENDMVYFRVNANSSVFAGVGTFEEVSISGLGLWVGEMDGYVTLHGTVENNQLTGLEVVWGEGDGGEQRAEYDDENRQTLLKTRLGLIYNNEDGALSVRQEAFSNFTAITSCYDGKPTICLIQT
jgi:hypothetical protein